MGVLAAQVVAGPLSLGRWVEAYGSGGVVTFRLGDQPCDWVGIGSTT
jgi:hypothetical protein